MVRGNSASPLPATKFQGLMATATFYTPKDLPHE